MRLPPFLMLLASLHAGAIPASTTLELVNEPGFNRVRIAISAQGANSNDTTILTGTMTADFNVDPQAHTTTEMTIRDGRASGTDMRFIGRVLFVVVAYDINLRNLSGTIATTNPPGVVDPQTGNFDASQHELILDQGQISGTALGDPVNAEFTPENPVGSPGSGTGSVTLTPTATDATHQHYQVTVTLPVAIDQARDIDGIAVTITGSGTLKAAGTLSVPKSEFIAWSITEGIENATFEDATPNDILPSGLRWAMGLNATENALPFLPKPLLTGGPAFTLTPRDSRAPVWIEESIDLNQWLPVPEERVAGGNNPLPPGSTGEVTVSPAQGRQAFIRLRADNG